MTVEQAYSNLIQLLNHQELRLNYQEHMGLRQSLQLLHQKALDGEELQKQVKEVESEKKEEVKDDKSNE